MCEGVILTHTHTHTHRPLIWKRSFCRCLVNVKKIRRGGVKPWWMLPSWNFRLRYSLVIVYYQQHPFSTDRKQAFDYQTAAHLLERSPPPFFHLPWKLWTLTVWRHQIVTDFFNVLGEGDMFLCYGYRVCFFPPFRISTKYSYEVYARHCYVWLIMKCAISRAVFTLWDCMILSKSSVIVYGKVTIYTACFRLTMTVCIDPLSTESFGTSFILSGYQRSCIFLRSFSYRYYIKSYLELIVKRNPKFYLSLIVLQRELSTLYVELMPQQ